MLPLPKLILEVCSCIEYFQENLSIKLQPNFLVTLVVLHFVAYDNGTYSMYIYDMEKKGRKCGNSENSTLPDSSERHRFMVSHSIVELGGD